MQTKKWYKKPWGILLLILFWYITVPIAIIQSGTSKKTKNLMWVGYAVLLLFLSIGFFIPESQTNENKMKVINQNIKTEKINKGENNIKEALKQIGIESDYKIIRDESLDGLAAENTTGYRVQTEFSQQGIPVYLNKDETVHSIRYADKDYYLNGKVLDNIKSDTLTRNEMYNYKMNVEEKVKSVLKAPSTAKFPNIDEWGFDKKDNIVTIQGYVDSQNSFGAMIRGEFKVKYNEKNEKITSFIFEGKEWIK